MTSDEFNSQYKLLKQMAVKEGRSYTAEHLPSGRAVLVHILDENQVGGTSGLHAMLERLEPREKSRVLGTMTVDRSLVVVTQFLQGFEGFEPWLRGRLAGPGAPTGTPSGPPPAEGHGEFTRLFRAQNTPAAPVDRSPPATDPIPGAAVPAGSGFTDLFRAPVAPTTPPKGVERADLPPLRIVGLRVPLPSEPASPQPASPEPGPLPPRLTPNLEGSEEPAAPPNLAGWPRPDEVIIRTGEPASAPVPPPSWGGGPSEFTREFGSVPQPTGELAQAQAPEVADPPEKPAESKRSYIPLFVVLNVVFIPATGLVVYFALRQC
jgi:hypothetical protein